MRSYRFIATRKRDGYSTTVRAQGETKEAAKTRVREQLGEGYLVQHSEGRKLRPRRRRGIVP